VTRIVHGLTWLAVIAVPAAGWFADDWSGGTTLLVYWFETAAVCLFIAARIAFHRQWNPRRGHFRYEAPRAGPRNSYPSFLKGFVIVSLAFCAGHGVFLGAILVVLNRDGEHALIDVNWRSVGFGCLAVLVLLVIDFVVDLRRLRRRSFLQIEQLADRGTSRIIVVQLTLLIGFLGIALTGAPTALFGALVALKTLFALSGALPRWEPGAAPKGLSRVMNRIVGERAGVSFEGEWDRDRAAEAERRARNEQGWLAVRR
jgi:hypothetical protein